MQVARLASFFEGLGTGWQSDTAAGYVAWVEIKFIGADGRQVHVVSDYALWSEGHGDRAVKSGFGQYVDTLFAKQLAGTVR